LMVQKVMWTIAINAITTWTSEWKFLPDVVLATITSVEDVTSAIRPSPNPTVNNFENNHNDDESSSTCSQEDEQSASARASPNIQSLQQQQQQKVGLQYGSLISCIDFGGQIGALLVGPLVALIGTSRENEWAHLDLLLQICSFAMLLPLLLLVVLR
jgi:hypothetical protein